MMKVVSIIMLSAVKMTTNWPLFRCTLDSLRTLYNANPLLVIWGNHVLVVSVPSHIKT